MDVSAVAPFTNVECPSCGKHTRVKREFGPYTLMRRHAVGGMSMVFVAHDNTLEREVALKILSEAFSGDERRISAFEEEARITASFSHPNVVRVLTTGHAFGWFYIAMEFVPGGHFEHQIRERGKIPEVEALTLAIEVAHGLKAAHEAGLIHRDVKPGNILLDAEGHAKLVDFGLALVTQGGKAQATELWATPYYVPPETVEGHPEDFRSDIYAFGATLYHALSGKPSCGEKSMATDVLREAKKRVLPLSAVDPSISTETCRIVERAMAYHANDRFSSYDEMIASLAVALSHVKSGRSESTASAASIRARKKRRELASMVSIGFCLLAVGVGAAWWSGRAKPEVKVSVPPSAVAPGVSTGVVDESAAAIGTSYRGAREAVEARDFAKASREFGLLFNNPAVQEPTRSWAGVEMALADFLDGRAADGRKHARETFQHIQSLPAEAQRMGGELIGILGKLTDLRPLQVFTPGASAESASPVLAAMLAGLKDWEQGLPATAVANFKRVVAAKLSAEDKWAEIYQKLAADYLADYQTLCGPLFSKPPQGKAEMEAAVDELSSVQVSLKTRGRARFNVRAWQQDLTRMAKSLGAAGETPTVSPSAPAKPENESIGLAEVLERLDDFSDDCRFPEAAAYLKSLPADPQGASRASLLALVESAVVFLADLEADLSKASVSLDLQLKTGETMTQVAIDADGAIIVATADGRTRSCKWRDFLPDTLIALHRVLVKSQKSELERLRRHECAIAYDWLSGNRERALAAAASLSQGSPVFKQRWDTIAAGLPE